MYIVYLYVQILYILYKVYIGDRSQVYDIHIIHTLLRIYVQNGIVGT